MTRADLARSDTNPAATTDPTNHRANSTLSTHPRAVYSRKWRARIQAELDEIRDSRPAWQYTPGLAPGDAHRAAALAEIDQAWFG